MFEIDLMCRSSFPAKEGSSQQAWSWPYNGTTFRSLPDRSLQTPDEEPDIGGGELIRRRKYTLRGRMKLPTMNACGNIRTMYAVNDNFAEGFQWMLASVWCSWASLGTYLGRLLGLPGSTIRLLSCHPGPNSAPTEALHE